MGRLVLRNVRPTGTRRTSNLVIAGDTIVAWCNDDDLREFSGPDTESLDLAGRVVTAGLTDSHVHPVLGIALTAGVDLSRCATLAEVRAALAAAPADEWLVGWGLDPNCFGDEPLGAAALSDVFGNRPALLRLFDAHSAIASDEALRRAGISGPRDFASRSEIGCDPSGRPTGLLLEEEALRPVLDVVPEPDFEQRRAQLRELLWSMAATGLTGGHVMDLDGDAPELYAALDAAGDLPLRLRLAPWRRPEDDDRRVAELLEMQGRHGRLWRIDGAKLFMDGTIDNGTAWLDEPDCHGESRDAYWRDPDAYTRAVHDLAAHGVQTATHAIGDAAVAHVLRTVAALPAVDRDVPAGNRARHRVEHLETLPDELLPQFAMHGVVASMQPTHATDYTRADHSDNWSRRLGHTRADRAWRCADLLRAGALVTLGSDWPVVPFDPRVVMAGARLRRPWDRPDLGPVGPDQALTAAQALHGYTEAPALTTGATRLGRIAPGALADLTVWDDDPLAQAADQLPHLPVALTVVDGVVRHRAGQ